ncbi:hypothetical protein LTR08_007062 [Meristemomyces frigidus]|nr:hypothetical protein LTR08_007062 [Meristemomyces frigidus]
MGRITRAKAAEVAEKLHIDEDAVLELPSEDTDGRANLASKTPEKDERAPLGEIAPPNSGGKEDGTEIADLRKSTKGRKGGKKGVKGKKNNLANSTASHPETLDELPDLAPSEMESEVEASPVGETAAEDLTKGMSDLAITNAPANDDITMQDEEMDVTEDQFAMFVKAEAATRVEIQTDVEPAESSSTSLQPAMEAAEHQSEPEPETLMATDALQSTPKSVLPAVIASLRKGTPSQRSTSNKENVEPRQASTPVPSALTPAVARSHRRSTTYDDLEEAVVLGVTPPAVSREPSLQDFPTAQPAPSSEQIPGLSVGLPSKEATLQSPKAPMSTPAKSADPQTATSPRSEDAIGEMDALEEAVDKVSAEVPDVQATPAKSRTKKAAPVVRTTKASMARLSLAQADKTIATKDHTLGRPRPSTMLNRANSVRQSIATRPEPASKRMVSTGSKRPEPAINREKKETVIPHSKPRPVNLSFPTPPPPPKSRKAPTTSTFQLPGEAVAAKLKAAREERTKKDAEDNRDDRKRTAFKARPAPTPSTMVPSVRQTTASKARESSFGSKPTGPATDLKRAKSVTTSTATASKARVPAKEPSTHSPTALKPVLDRLTVAKRTSTATANISKPRTSLSTSGPVPASGTTQRVPSKGTVKGKEVFNRAAAAKGAAEKEKREKEEAAKKARAAAADRGRQLSRDWAEKQRMKELGLKGEMAKSTGPETKVEGVPVQGEATAVEARNGGLVAGV